MSEVLDYLSKAFRRACVPEETWEAAFKRCCVQNAPPALGDRCWLRGEIRSAAGPSWRVQELHVHSQEGIVKEETARIVPLDRPASEAFAVQTKGLVVYRPPGTESARIEEAYASVSSLYEDLLSEPVRASLPPQIYLWVRGLRAKPDFLLTLPLVCVENQEGVYRGGGHVRRHGVPKALQAADKVKVVRDAYESACRHTEGCRGTLGRALAEEEKIKEVLDALSEVSFDK